MKWVRATPHRYQIAWKSGGRHGIEYPDYCCGLKSRPKITPNFYRRLLCCQSEDFGLPALRIASLGDRAGLCALRGGDRSRGDAKGAQYCRIAVRLRRIRGRLDRSPRSGAAKRFARPPAECRERVAVLPWIDSYPRGGLHDRQGRCLPLSALKSSFFPQLSPLVRLLSRALMPKADALSSRESIIRQESLRSANG